MKTTLGKIGVGILTATILAGLPVHGVERICSVYIESTAALQQQVQDAALIFEAPELGMFPMMMTMVVPGGSQVKTTEPVSLHVFDIGGGKTASVVEVTPATTAEMFLKSLTAASGKPLAPAVEGRYTFDSGVAQVVGVRLLLAKTAAELDACTGRAVPALPPMPSVPGVVRVALAPSAVVPMLDLAQSQMLNGMSAMGGADVESARGMMNMVFNLYKRTLAQLNTLTIGIGVQQEGVMVRSTLVPVSGSTVAEILDSVQPVKAAYLGFVEKDSLFSVASGSYSLSDQLKRQLVSLYIDLVEMTHPTADIKLSELRFAMRESIESVGAALAWSMDMTGKEFLMQGAMGVASPVSYLEKMVALQKMPAMQALTAQSGVQMETAKKRMYKDYPVYDFNMTFDEETVRKQMGEAGQQMDAEAFAVFDKMMTMFGSGYAYAATPNGVAFGLGKSTMVEAAADRLMKDKAAMAEVTRIRTLLSPSSAPVAIGRFGLLDAVRAAANLASEVAGTPVPSAVSALPAGEGIIFADWMQGNDVNSAVLVPATDVKALTAMAKRIKADAASAGDSAPMAVPESVEPAAEDK